MILEPANDGDCLGQLTRMARELMRTTLVETVAERLGSPRAVVRWIRSLPQTDDEGGEQYRYVACDVPQRVRLLPDDPNCFERAFAALMLLEVLEPSIDRRLLTVEKPQRHTGLVEWRGGGWMVVDLFPRRNGDDWVKVGKDVLLGVHEYVGKPILKLYAGDAGGKVADAIGEQEAKIGGEPARAPPAKPAPSTAAPKPQQPAKGEGGHEERQAKLERPAARPADGGGGDPPQTEAERWGWRS